MPAKFERQMGVCWQERPGLYFFGVVASTSNDGSIDVVMAEALEPGMKCYNDGGANYERDRHRVRLESCPPPFTYLCVYTATGQCAAMADPGDIRHLPAQAMDAMQVSVIDGGAKISDKDFAAIKDHPWRDEKECDKPMSNMDQLSKMLADMDAASQNTGNSGPQYGN